MSFHAISQIKSIDCPFGSDKSPKTHFIDSMKNRFTIPIVVTNHPFDYVYGMRMSDDYSACKETISITGYVLEVADGGVESCNCGSATIKDTHIYIVKDNTVTSKSEAVIVEVTPAFRAKFGKTIDLKHQWTGKIITVSGYLFQDQEHKMNSKVDGGKSLLWRHTIWEIHPVTDVKIN